MASEPVSSDSAMYKLTKSQRLLTAKDYKACFDNTDIKMHGSELLLFARRADTSRLGLALTKKKIPNASERNRVKRYCREVFRLTQSSWQVPKEIVVVAKKNTHSLSDTELHHQVMTIFEQLDSKLARKIAKTTSKKT